MDDREQMTSGPSSEPIPEGDLDEKGAEAAGRPHPQRRSGARSDRPRRHEVLLPRGAAIVLGALAIVGVVAAIVFGFAWANLNGQNAQREVVKQDTVTFLKDLTNFKPATVDADFAALQNWAASGSQFEKQAAQTFNSNIRQELLQAKASSLGEIRNIYVESVSGSSAEVYAVVDQSYQNSKITTPDTDVLRVTVDLTDTAQGWRVSTVTVENPSSSPSTPTAPEG
jgi:hypothetical protein